jgi:hypothetical protein
MKMTTVRVLFADPSTSKIITTCNHCQKHTIRELSHHDITQCYDVTAYKGRQSFLLFLFVGQKNKLSIQKQTVLLVVLMWSGISVVWLQT